MTDIYYNLDAINELADIACNDPDRLMEELNIDCRIQGKKYAGTCPVHEGNNPTAFNFYPDGESVRGFWVCRTHNCHIKWKKNLVGLIRGIKSKETGKNFSWKDAVNWLVKFNGMKTINELVLPNEQVINRRKSTRTLHKLNIGNSKVTSGWSRDWVRDKLEIPAKYYIDRGFSPAILDKYDVGYYKPQNRVSVPVYDDDYKFCVGFAARSLNEQCKKCNLYHESDKQCPKEVSDIISATKWKNSLDFESSNYLYNYWFAKKEILKNGTAILVEGPGDVWKLEENNIKIGLALFGVELTESQRVILDRSGALSLIILLDNDEAGINASKILKQKLGRAYRLYFPKITSKDVGDLHSDAITSDIQPFIKQAELSNI